MGKYLRDVLLGHSSGIHRPLPVRPHWLIQRKRGREDDSNGLVFGIVPPVELAAVDVHGMNSDA